MPSRTPRIFEIMVEVDKALPEHGRGVILPQEMAITHAASCFGRLAVVGSQLVEEGFASKNLGWLISLNHGIEFAKDKPWLGHAMLTVKPPRPRLIDARHHTWARRPSTTSWRPSNESKLPVVDYVVLKEMLGQMFLPSEIKRKEEPLSYLRRRALQAFFSQHEFHEGIAFYQAEHADLNSREPLSASDYANFYNELGNLNQADQTRLTA